MNASRKTKNTESIKWEIIIILIKIQQASLTIQGKFNRSLLMDMQKLHKSLTCSKRISTLMKTYKDHLICVWLLLYVVSTFNRSLRHLLLRCVNILFHKVTRMPWLCNTEPFLVGWINLHLKNLLYILDLCRRLIGKQWLLDQNLRIWRIKICQNSSQEAHPAVREIMSI